MYLTTSSLETFGFCFLYSCSCSYFSVRKLLRSSFCLSDRFSSAPRRFSSVAMLLSSSGVMIFLFLGGFDFLEELTGGRPDQIQPCGSYPWFLGYARHHSRMRRRGQEPQGGSRSSASSCSGVPGWAGQLRRKCGERTGPSTQQLV